MTDVGHEQDPGATGVDEPTIATAEPGAPHVPDGQAAPGAQTAPGEVASAEETPPGEAPTPAPEPAPAPTFVVVEVVNVSYELPSPHPVIHLLEQEMPFRGLDFPLGLPEAQSIAYALEHEQPPRPTTHDLMVSLMAAVGCEVVAVRLTGERNGTILGELDVMGPKGHEVLDCRPSDGIAVALRLRVPAPILCEAGLLDR
ncbi:MAG TPA: bifunctional nuclease family protein [Acidimicrobiales bacterium]|nr:bifunctional nuclease family protein [Acidimicrobiales bacterium]